MHTRAALRRIVLGGIAAAIAYGAVPGSALAATSGEPYLDSCISRVTSGTCTARGVLGRPAAMVIAPGGSRAYVAFVGDSAGSGSGVQAYDRNATTGALTPRAGTTNCVSSTGSGGACQTYAALSSSEIYDMAIDSGGDHLYVPGVSAVSVLGIGGDGGLSPLSCVGVAGGCSAVTGGWTAATAVEIDPVTGDTVYVRDNNRLYVFDRDSDTGALTQKGNPDGCLSEAGAAGCTDVNGIGGVGTQLAFSPGGEHLYVANSVPGGVAIFTRGSTGTLSQGVGSSGGCVTTDGSSGGTASQCVDGAESNLAAARSVVVDPGGDFVYVSGDNGLAAFSRDGSSGKLTHVECYVKGADAGACKGRPAVSGLDLAMTSDGSELVLSNAGSSGPMGFLLVHAASGKLTARAGTHGCWSIDGSGGTCEIAPTNADMPALALSADDRFVYLGGSVSSGPDGTMLTFHRDFPPVCSPVSAQVQMNTVQALGLSCSDPNGDALTYAIAAGPLAGSLGAIDQSAASVVYSPFTGFTGADSFTFTATARGLSAGAATASLDVVAPAAGGGGTTPPPVTPPAGEPAAPLPLVAARVRARWLAGRAFTRARRLIVFARQRGSRVAVSCKGRGCPFKRLAAQPRKGKVNLSRRFRKAKLRPRARIEIRVTRAGATGRVFRYTIRRGKKPALKRLCLAPGASRPTACS